MMDRVRTWEGKRNPAISKKWEKGRREVERKLTRASKHAF